MISNNTGHVDLAGDHAYVLAAQHTLRVAGVGPLPGGFAGWGGSDVGEVVAALRTIHDNPEAACAKGVRMRLSRRIRTCEMDAFGRCRMPRNFVLFFPVQDAPHFVLFFPVC